MECSDRVIVQIEEDGNEVPKKTKSGSVLMPCTSTTDVAEQRSIHTNEPLIILDSSDEELCQSREDLTVTFRTEQNATRITGAKWSLKGQDPVENFLRFAGAILRSIGEEPLKLKLIDDITQILIDAKTEEIQRKDPDYN